MKRLLFLALLLIVPKICYANNPTYGVPIGQDYIYFPTKVISSATYSNTSSTANFAFTASTATYYIGSISTSQITGYSSGGTTNNYNTYAIYKATATVDMNTNQLINVSSITFTQNITLPTVSVSSQNVIGIGSASVAYAGSAGSAGTCLGNSLTASGLQNGTYNYGSGGVIVNANQSNSATTATTATNLANTYYSISVDTAAYSKTCSTSTYSLTSGTATVAKSLIIYTVLPSSVVAITGTLAGGTTNLWDYNVNFDTITEGTGTDPERVNITFANVTIPFTQVILRSQYAGGSNHIVNIEIYNTKTTNWDLLQQISLEASMFWHTYSINNYTDYIDAGSSVTIRFNHQGVGNPSHRLYIDYAALQANGMGASSITPTYQAGTGGISAVGSNPTVFNIVCSSMATGDYENIQVATATSAINLNNQPASYYAIQSVVASSTNTLFNLIPSTWVAQVKAGTNITISPTDGHGIVTINSSGGSSTPIIWSYNPDAIILPYFSSFAVDSGAWYILNHSLDISIDASPIADNVWGLNGSDIYLKE